MIGVFIPIIAIVGAVYIVIHLRRYQNTERMAMIDKGVDPALFAKKTRNTSGALRAALLFIGAGVGLLLGASLDKAFDMEETGYFSMVFVCGGVGLLIAYLVEEKKAKNEPQ